MDAVALAGGVAGSLAACAVMIAAAALVGWRLDAVSRSGGGADDYFWIGFGGLVVITGAGLVAGSSGGAGAMPAVVVGIVCAGAAVTWAWWRHDRRGRAAAEASRAGAAADLRRRHAEVVRRWADYDVDPAKAIRYPAMHDPRHPVGWPVVRALRAADAARDGDASTDPAGYAAAVGRLEQAFETAEHDLAAPDERRPARHRAFRPRP
ncbi:hypothetical protein [Arthrobacter sp. B0490]|uniref:hypothetical protein n=1 Tax=Arthrobacter sp. B0490 TaxID=2058891 RepID=UPI0011B049EC|nr:hypothetical protein [Arthrobacter sp. B0490]